MSARKQLLTNIMKQCKKSMSSGSDEEFESMLKGAKKDVKKEEPKEEAKEAPKKKTASATSAAFLEFIKDKVEKSPGKTMIFKGANPASQSAEKRGPGRPKKEDAPTKG